MKKLFLLPFILFALLGCDSDDEAEFSIVGKKFKYTNIILDTSVDLNNDGVYSFDLLSEIVSSPNNNCLDYPLEFFEENLTVRGFVCDYAPIFEVRYDDDGNPFQYFTCGMCGSSLLNYEQNRTSINFYFNWENNPSIFMYTGELSQNNTVLTFSNVRPMVSGQILREDGTIEQYGDINSTATYIFELVED